MSDKTTTLSTFHIIGLPLRTSNDKMKEIVEHWGKFYSQNIINKIPDKINNEVVAVYTEYVGDFTKPYTLIIGCKVSSIDNVPAGLVVKTIPETKYSVFTAKGKMPDCIGETWRKIWDSDIDRAYTFDFEVYGEKSQDPNDAEIGIYISVK